MLDALKRTWRDFVYLLNQCQLPTRPGYTAAPTDGSFTVTCNGETSDQIPWDASAFEVGYVLDRPDRKVYGTTGAETDLEFYTDPKPWEFLLYWPLSEDDLIMFSELKEVWGTQLWDWQIIVGGSDDHIVRSEN